MTLPPRLVTILVPVQCFMVLLGWAICRKLVRVAEGRAEDLYWLWPMPGLIWFAAHFGWLIASLSCLWGLSATLRADVYGREAILRDWDARAGLGLTVLIVLGTFWCVARTLGWVFNPPLVPMRQV